MKYCRILFAIAFFAVAGLSARGEFIFVKGKEKPLVGTVLSEDAKWVKYTPTGGKKMPDQDLPAADILEIHYESIKPADLGTKGGAYREAKDAEKEAEDGGSSAAAKKALTRAIQKYTETSNKMAKDTKAQLLAARHITFKIAMLTLKKANLEQQPTDLAVARLNKFSKDYPNSWQIHQVWPTLATLHVDAKDYPAAVEVYETMSNSEYLTAEAKRDAKLAVVQVFVRAGNIPEANKKLDSLEKEAGANAAFKSRVKMARAEVLVGQKKNDEATVLLRDVVKESNDRQTKALAHNILGECLYKAGKLDEAKWEFLFVDAVFNHDKQQQAKALYYLVEIFDKLGDGPRAQECREKLMTSEFSGTEHQRLMSAKTK